MSSRCSLKFLAYRHLLEYPYECYPTAHSCNCPDLPTGIPSSFWYAIMSFGLLLGNKCLIMIPGSQQDLIRYLGGKVFIRYT